MTLLADILAVFTGIGDWITDAVTQLMTLFYDSDAGLTLLGTLAVCALGFSVIFLIIGIIQRFLHFRG